MDKDAVFEKLKEILTTDFKLEPDSIKLGSSLEEDLELDSLDVVDILISLEDYIEKKIDPTLFKNAKTVQDMVDLLLPLWK